MSWEETVSTKGPTCPICGDIYTPDEACFYDEDTPMEIECCSQTFQVHYSRTDWWTIHASKEIT